MKGNAMTEYNLSSVYDSELAEKIAEIRTICTMKNIPFFFAFAVKNNAKGTTYETDLLSAGAQSIELTDDKFPDLVNVMNGFGTYLKKPDTEDVLLDAIRELPEEIIQNDYASLLEDNEDEEDFYIEE